MVIETDGINLIGQAHEELAPYQAQLTAGEIFRASAVFERISEIKVEGSDNPNLKVAANTEGYPTIFRVDNRANSVQRSLTILFQSKDSQFENKGTEVVLLGAFVTDHFDQATEGFVQRGYKFQVHRELK